jgi:hypothetical protein
MYMCPIPNGFRDTAISMYRRAIRHALTRVAKCADVDGGILENVLYQGWRKLYNEELHNLHSSRSIIRMIKSRRMRWAGHVARMGAKRNAYRILVGKPEGRRPLGRPRRRLVDNIKMNLRDIGWYGIDWIDVAQDTDQWRALVNTVMKLRVP